MKDNELTRNEKGVVENTLSNLRALIDRYVPTVTREQVWELESRHADATFALLSQLHEAHERNRRLAERMDAMEKEFYSKVKMPVSLGKFGVGVHLDPLHITRNIRVVWKPEPYAMAIALRDEPFINDRDTPLLFEMVGRQFEEAATRELIPALRRQYQALYNDFNR